MKREINKEAILRLISQHLSGKEISKRLNISRRTLYNYMAKFNIDSIKLSYIDDSVFDKIDTEEKAYWLGFLYADGSISSSSYQIELSLSSVDVNHIKKFKRFLNDSRLDDDVIKLSMVKEKYEIARYSVGSQHLHERLFAIGCTPRKSLTLRFPDKNIFSQENLILDFIRGYFDGDGCIYKVGNNRLAIEILGTPLFLTEIKTTYFPEFHGPVKDSRNNVYRIYCGFSPADQVCFVLYENKHIYLDRKFEKYATLCKLHNSETSGNIGEICDDNTEITGEISKGSSEL